ncbi:right-handed parallel beta-helix repeat-containing protein [Vallitalea pronyensis]|nr:right-handed parallel beta-helix repeat-containing protein [Vallitalea pronyensis]
MMIYYVSNQATQTGTGTKESPFSTISQAATMAQPGDEIIVMEGIYREWVNPVHGGESDERRIVYRSNEGDKVIITGSEIINNWKAQGNGVWKVEIDNSFFGHYNPFVDELYGDWFDDHGYTHHTGEVFINDHALYEVPTLEQVLKPEEGDNPDPWFSYKWFCQSDKATTTIWANFHDMNPNETLVEISVRPYCFWPEKTGVNYITVSGFIMKNAATQWAPPTALQTGLIGTHWSKGWIIEHNTISNSKCSGISIGKKQDPYDNEWSKNASKGGAQTFTEVVFNALRDGWHRDTVGSHIIRHNEIFDCGQTGIVGSKGCIFSQISNNHIYNINSKGEFSGAELAAIKLHCPIDTQIIGNRLHHSARGLWLDWETQGTRISQNIMYDNNIQDLYIEVCHGPCIVDNNIFLSEDNLRYQSQGTAFIHNLFCGKLTICNELRRFTPYHFPHETDILGVMVILGGDDRVYNNIFMGNHSDDSAFGTTEYDKYITVDELNQSKTDDKPLSNDVTSIPIEVSNNIYLNNAKCFRKEHHPTMIKDARGYVDLIEDANGLSFKTNLGNYMKKSQLGIINTEGLKRSFQSQQLFENPDLTPIIFDRDLLGVKRDSAPTVGPFENLMEGEHIIRIPSVLV